MGFTGVRNMMYEEVLFMIYAILSCFLFIFQIFFLQKIRALPVYILPVVSFCICFDNLVCFRGDKINENSSVSKAAFVFNSLIPACLLLTSFEMPYRLHEARSVHFLYISFEEGQYMPKYISTFTLFAVRLLAIGILIAKILANFELVGDDNISVGIAGYASFSKDDNANSIILWLDLLPSMIVGFNAIVMALILRKYGQNMTFAIRNQNIYWRSFIPCSIIYCVSKVFKSDYYRTTSPAGDIVLVFGLSVVIDRIQKDLAVAGSFADYLAGSNIAFHASSTATATASPKNPPSAGGGHGHHNHGNESTSPANTNTKPHETGAGKQAHENASYDKKDNSEPATDEETGNVELTDIVPVVKL